MLSKKITDKWRDEYDRQLTLSQRQLARKVQKYYEAEYNKGVKNFVETGDTGYTSLFKYSFFDNIYRELYNTVSMRFAKWYARNFTEYTQKKDITDFEREWDNAFDYYAKKVAATNVVLVKGTAQKTLIRITQRLMRDPDYYTKGAEERARILRSKFKGYSRVQALRFVRTESLRAASYGIEQSAYKVYAGRKLMKQWVTFIDNNTRDWHTDANNQVKEFEEDFEVGGEYMRRPGEGSGFNVINCRCSMIPFPQDIESTITSI